MNRARRLAPLLALALLAAVGCSSTPQQPDAPAIGALAARYASSMQGAPYRYGGSSPRGFDCSGLVQYSYARAGARVPRTTREQWRHSRAVSLKRLRPGDLLFFNLEGKRNSHVGLYVGRGRFVHAPSSGKTVSLATLEQRYWRRHLAGARRLHLR